MSTFVLIKRTAFKKLEEEHKFHSFAREANVRRPYMGIQDVKDRHATIVVFTKEGKKLDILDLHSLERTGRTKNYTNFTVQNIQRSAQEKYQIIETWGEEWLLTYGKKPEIWVISGTLVSSVDFPWEAEFWYNYEHLFRSTRLAEEGARIFMEVENMYMSGYMLQAQAVKQWEYRNRVQFVFHLFITNSGFFDTWREEALQVNLKPGDTTRISMREAPKVDPSEYAQMAQRPKSKATKKPEPDKWKSTRHAVLNDNVPNYDQQPHMAARVTGAIPGPALPSTYALQLGQGFRGGKTPVGKDATARKEKGLFTNPFDFDAIGKRTLKKAGGLFSKLKSVRSLDDLRSLAGEAKKTAEGELGLLQEEFASPLDRVKRGLTSALGQSAKSLPKEARKVLDILEIDADSLGSVRAPLSSETYSPWSHVVRRMIKRSADVKTLTDAQEVMRSAKTRVNLPTRFPRPGAFLFK